MPKEKLQTPCPTCRKLIVWGEESPWRPFCSERCRIIDLGDWLDETHRIPEPLDEYSDEPAEISGKQN